MKEIEDLKEKKEKRWLFLNKLYELSGGSTHKWPDVDTICEELGFDMELSRDIVTYLRDEGLIEVKCDRPTLIAISHEGIVEVEEFLSNPDRPTQHFLPVNIINVNQMTNSNIQQASPEAKQVVTFDESKYEELKEVIRSLKESIDQLGLEPQQKPEFQADIQMIEAQMASSKPKATIITERLGSIGRILEGATSSVLASSLLSEIVAIGGG